jgi:hypothetical protein
MEKLNREAAAEFWSWFIRNELELSRIGNSEDPLMTDLMSKLHRIHEDLFFELGTNFEPHELVITAEGKRRLFPLVDELAASAPVIPQWKIVALKPPQGFDFVTNFEGSDYDPKTMWFLPMIRKQGEESLLGLRVGIPHLDLKKKAEAQTAVLIILDTALGERTAAEEIHYLDACPLPDAPADQGFIELMELPRYIEWKKKQ